MPKEEMKWSWNHELPHTEFLLSCLSHLARLRVLSKKHQNPTRSSCSLGNPLLTESLPWHSWFFASLFQCPNRVGETVLLFSPYLLFALMGDVSETFGKNSRLLVTSLGKTSFQCAWRSYRRKNGGEGLRLVFQASPFLDMLLVSLVNLLYPKNPTLLHNSLFKSQSSRRLNSLGGSCGSTQL